MLHTSTLVHGALLASALTTGVALIQAAEDKKASV
jgi:hypothetical protein